MSRWSPQALCPPPDAVAWPGLGERDSEVTVVRVRRHHDVDASHVARESGYCRALHHGASGVDVAGRSARYPGCVTRYMLACPTPSESFVSYRFKLGMMHSHALVPERYRINDLKSRRRHTSLVGPIGTSIQRGEQCLPFARRIVPQVWQVLGPRSMPRCNGFQPVLASSSCMTQSHM